MEQRQCDKGSHNGMDLLWSYGAVPDLTWSPMSILKKASQELGGIMEDLRGSCQLSDLLFLT